jgi:tetratricopeptide (TPR) repeat protein
VHDASLAGPGEKCRVAVLAFRGVPGRARDDWLAVELVDSLARKLDCLGGLAFLDAGEVRSHERRRLKGEEALDDRETARLARRIGADIVVSGTVARKGDAVSVEIEAGRPSSAVPPGRIRVDGHLGRLCELEARMAARLAALLGVPPSDVDLERLAACPTSSPAAFEELARARQARDGSHARIQHLQKAVEADPGCVEARVMLGDAYYGIGATYRYVEWFNMALAEYRKAAALSPNCGEAYRGMGLVYMMNGRYDLARRALEKAVETTPDPMAARSALARLEGMGR